MKPVDHKDDTKILMTIAGVTIAGAVGVALLAGWRANDDRRAEMLEETSRARPAVAAMERKPTQPAMAASFETQATPVERPQPEPQPQAVEPEIEASTADLGDPVQQGLEAYHAKDYARAAEQLTRAIDARPQRAWTHFLLGLSLWKSGSADEAVVALEQAARLDSGSAKTFINLSRVQNDRGEYTAALEAAREALRVAPNDAAALFLEGRSLRNLGRLDEAEASLRASIEQDGTDGHVHNLLGLLLIDSERHAEAAQTLSVASELAPEVAYVRNNLGMALERSGTAREALESYAEAVRLDEGHGVALANLERLRPIVDGLPPEATDSPVKPEATASIAVEGDAEVIASVAPDGGPAR